MIPNNRSLVSLAFCGGLKSHVDIVAPILREHSVKATFYVISTYLGDEKYSLFMDINDVSRLSVTKHEIGVSSDASFRHLSKGEVKEELDRTRNVLKKSLGVYPTSFAYPGGEWDAEIVTAARQVGFFTALTWSRGHNKPESDPLLLSCYRIDQATKFAEVKEMIDAMEGDLYWLILSFDDIISAKSKTDNLMETFDAKLLSEIVAYLKESGTTVLPVSKAMSCLVERTGYTSSLHEGQLRFVS